MNRFRTIPVAALLIGWRCAATSQAGRLRTWASITFAQTHVPSSKSRGLEGDRLLYWKHGKVKQSSLSPFNPPAASGGAPASLDADTLAWLYEFYADSTQQPAPAPENPNAAAVDLLLSVS